MSVKKYVDSATTHVEQAQTVLKVEPPQIAFAIGKLESALHDLRNAQTIINLAPQK